MCTFLITGTLPHKHKVIIAGNHDITFDLDHVKKNVSKSLWSLNGMEDLEARLKHFGVKTTPEMLTDCIYLEDSSVEIYGIKIYGSPWLVYLALYKWFICRHLVIYVTIKADTFENNKKRTSSCSFN